MWELGFQPGKAHCVEQPRPLHSTGPDCKCTKVKGSTSGELSGFDNEQKVYVYFQSELRDISPFIKMEVVPRMSG